jgi:hypothetical protein
VAFGLTVAWVLVSAWWWSRGYGLPWVCRGYGLAFGLTVVGFWSRRGGVAVGGVAVGMGWRLG